MTYNVFDGTLNLALSIYLASGVLEKSLLNSWVGHIWTLECDADHDANGAFWY